MDTKPVVSVAAPPAHGGAATWSARTSAITHNRVLRVIIRRLLLAVPLLFVVSSLSFVLISAIGNPAAAILGPLATPQQVAQLNRQFGLNLPLYTQYWHWLVHAVHGNLGTSLFTEQPVSQTISQRFPVTLSLVIGSFVVTVVLGSFLGVVSAVRGGAFGRVVDGVSLVGFALPSFWVGAVLVAIFAVKLRWLPAIGYVSISQSPLQWLRSIILPVTALSLAGIAVLAKQTREAMLDVLSSEHIRMAWANGIAPRDIYFKLALKNASLRIVTVSGILLVGLTAGTLFVEEVFALPGLGSIFTTSAQGGDLPVVEGITVFFTALIVVINLVVDVVYTLLDPRVQSS